MYCKENLNPIDGLSVDSYGIALLSAGKYEEASLLYEEFFHRDSNNNYINSHFLIALRKSGIDPLREAELSQKLNSAFKDHYIPRLEELLKIQ